MIERSDSDEVEINSNESQLSKNIEDKNSKENLVKDLKDSLDQSLDESISMLNSLRQEIQEKVKDESVNEETKKLVELLRENILNLVSKNPKKSIFGDGLKKSETLNKILEETYEGIPVEDRNLEEE
jgi:predicted flavoprotein YhiN